MSDSPHDPTDVRDERIAALLETEPLDELTRARLVRTAMDASEPGSVPATASPWVRRSRWIAAAAAIVLLGVVLFGVFALQDSSDTVNDASTRSAPNPTASDERLAAPEAGSTEAASAFSVMTHGELGELGDVGTPGRLRAAVTAVLPPPATDTEGKASNRITELSPTARTEDLTLEYRALPDCPAGRRRPAGSTIAVGTGSVDGQPVGVVVVLKADGSRVAVVLDADGCATGERVKL